MRAGPKGPITGPRPCACAYDVNPVFTSESYNISTDISTRRTILSVFHVLMLMLMLTQFSFAYTCTLAYAYTYALVKTTLKAH